MNWQFDLNYLILVIQSIKEEAEGWSAVSFGLHKELEYGRNQIELIYKYNGQI